MDKEKFIRLEKRDDAPFYVRLLNPICCVLLAFVFCGIVMQILGNNPLIAYKGLLKGAFGSAKKIGNTFIYAIPLILCSLSVATAFKMKLSNVGAEGQMTMGCWAACGVGLFCKFIPEGLTIPAMIIAGFLAGGIWAVISILPKVLWNVNEVILTLLMNYIAIYFAEYFIFGPWKDPNGDNMPFTAKLESYARLPKLFNSNVNAGIVIALICAVVLFFIFKKTVWGYKIAVVGESRRSAQYAGIDIRKSILTTMLIGGGMAGLAGMCEFSGNIGMMKENMANGVGYTAIIIAYLSQFNPLVCVIVSILFGALSAGSLSMQISGLPVQIVTMLQGAILLFVLGGHILLSYKIKLRKPAAKAAASKTEKGRA